MIEVFHSTEIWIELLFLERPPEKVASELTEKQKEAELMKKNAMNNLWKIGELLIISNSVKVGCVVPIVVVYILLHAEFGRNDHPEDAPILVNHVSEN